MTLFPYKTIRTEFGRPPYITAKRVVTVANDQRCFFVTIPFLYQSSNSLRQQDHQTKYISQHQGLLSTIIHLHTYTHTRIGNYSLPPYKHHALHRMQRNTLRGMYNYMNDVITSFSKHLPTTIYPRTPSKAIKQIGYKHGSLASAQISASIAFYSSLFLENAKQTWPEVLQHARTFEQTTAQKWPAFHEEMRGIADGAGRDLLDIVALNVRTEINFGLFTEGCTSLAWHVGQRAWLAQNWDVSIFSLFDSSGCICTSLLKLC